MILKIECFLKEYQNSETGRWRRRRRRRRRRTRRRRRRFVFPRPGTTLSHLVKMTSLIFHCNGVNNIIN
jgi:hypothetical protein